MLSINKRHATPWTWLAIMKLETEIRRGRLQKRRNNNNHVGIRGKNEVVFGVYDTIFYNRYDKVPKKSVSSVVGVPFFISYLFQAWMCVVKDYRTIEYSEL